MLASAKVFAMRAMRRLGSSVGKLLSPRKKLHLLALVLVLVGAFGARAAFINESLPYCNHTDEDIWARIALRMVRRGDLHPHRFRKPSLPVYLMAAGFSGGLLHARLTGKAESARDLGGTAYPFYTLPSAALPAKLLFALASVLALGFAGYTGACLTGRAALLWLTPLLGSLSSTYLSLSWTYMGVDVIGAFFVWGTLAYLAHLRARGLSLSAGPGALRRLVTLGVLAGFAVGSKYNLFPVLVPCVLWLALFERERWLKCSALLGAISVVAFFVTTPFALVSPDEFIEGIQAEIHHYATGHGRFTVPSGLPMFVKQLGNFAENFGALPSLLAVCGLVLAFRHDARLTLVVFSHAAVFIGYMSLQRVFFERNGLALHLHFALALAVAIVELPVWLAGAISARWPRIRLPHLKVLVGAFVVAVLLLGVPWSRVALAYTNDTNARVRASDWLLHNLERKPRLIVDPAVMLDYRGLVKRARVTDADPEKDAALIQKLSERARRVFVVCELPRRAAYEAVLGPLTEKARFPPSLRTCDVTCPDLVVYAR
jgi:hypothetical protein